jgi:hypothetical protein
MHTGAGWTPYEGMVITGRVVTTIVRGKVVFHDGKVIGEKGHGTFIRPFRSHYNKLNFRKNHWNKVPKDPPFSKRRHYGLA